MRAQSKQPGDQQSKRKASGFSLIELLIVVGIILIIAAIAIPNFIRSKMRANETSAAENLRTVDTANVVYSTTYGIGFAPTLLALGGNPGTTPDATQAGLLDSVLSTGTKSGYSFTYVVVNSDSMGHVTDYSVNADPLVQGGSGDRHFYTDQSAIIRENDTAIAGPNDPALQ